jgi:hypothetical protein
MSLSDEAKIRIATPAERAHAHGQPIERADAQPLRGEAPAAPPVSTGSTLPASSVPLPELVQAGDAAAAAKAAGIGVPTRNEADAQAPAPPLRRKMNPGST